MRYIFFILIFCSLTLFSQEETQVHNDNPDAELLDRASIPLDTLLLDWKKALNSKKVAACDSLLDVILTYFDINDLQENYDFMRLRLHYLVRVKEDYENGIATGLKVETLLKESQPKYQQAKRNLNAKMSDAYFYTGKLDLALERVEANLEIPDEKNPEKSKGVTLLNMGVLSYEMKNYTKALHHEKAALKIFKELEDGKMISVTAGNMAIAYSSYYQDNQQKVYLDSAEFAFAESKAYIASADSNGIYHYYTNLAAFYIDTEQLEKASAIFDSAANYLAASDVDSWFTFYKNNTTFYKKAKEYEKMEESVLEFQNFLETAYTDKLNYDLEALRWSMEQECVLREEKQQEEMASQKARSGLISILAIGSVLLLALMAGLLYQLYSKRKKESELYSLRQQLMRSQMNPHFTFNTLANIKAMINQEQTKAASKYLNKFSNLLRISLDNSVANDVALDKEIEAVQLYLELQKIRFEDRFTYELNVNLENPEDYTIPTMLLQPFVENCFKHAFKGIDYTGHIKIDIKKDETDGKGQVLLCEIFDNGVGLNATVTSDSSLSFKITNRRLELLQNQFETKGKLELLKNPNTPSGALVKITIPYRI